MATLAPDPPSVSRLRRAVYRRMVRQLRASISEMSEHDLLGVVEAPSLAESVARVVSAVPAAGAEIDDDWGEELLRGAAAKQAMLRLAGGCYSPGEAATVLGVSPQAVHQRRRRRALLAVPLASGEWGFPVGQFGAGGRIRPGVPRVLREAPEEISPWVLLSMLVSGQAYLDGDAPLERLDEPAVADAVAEMVRTYGEQGAT